MEMGNNQMQIEHVQVEPDEEQVKQVEDELAEVR